MGWLVKKKKKELTEKQVARAEKVAHGLWRVQRKWADFMHAFMSNYSVRQQKMLLLLCLLLAVLLVLLTTGISRRWLGLE